MRPDQLTTRLFVCYRLRHGLPGAGGAALVPERLPPPEAQTAGMLVATRLSPIRGPFFPCPTPLVEKWLVPAAVPVGVSPESRSYPFCPQPQIKSVSRCRPPIRLCSRSLGYLPQHVMYNKKNVQQQQQQPDIPSAARVPLVPSAAQQRRGHRSYHPQCSPGPVPGHRTSDESAL